MPWRTINQGRKTALPFETRQRSAFPTEETSRGTRDDPLAIVHEPEAHRIELETQNEELQRALPQGLKTAQEKYFDFYDLAPVGYLTLDETGLISELNLAAAELLGMERKTPRQ